LDYQTGYNDLTVGTPTVTTAGWYQYTVTIPTQFNGPTNYLMFKANSDWYNDPYLDDISLPALSQVPITTVAGTGSSVNFGQQGTAGVYMVTATSADGCVTIQNGLDTLFTLPTRLHIISIVCQLTDIIASAARLDLHLDWIVHR